MIVQYSHYVDVDNIEWCGSSKSKLRYYLIIPFKKGRTRRKGTALVIMKNPSKANKYISDDTVYCVLDYLYKKGFSKVIIVNLFAYYGSHFPNFNEVVEKGKDITGRRNDCIINTLINSLGKEDKIILAWGEATAARQTLKKLYSRRINAIRKIVNGKKVYCVGDTTKKLKPKHGMMWYDYEKLNEYIFPE